jgi:hypothetical protein
VATEPLRNIYVKAAGSTISEVNTKILEESQKKAFHSWMCKFLQPQTPVAASLPFFRLQRHHVNPQPGEGRCTRSKFSRRACSWIELAGDLHVFQPEIKFIVSNR